MGVQSVALVMNQGADFNYMIGIQSNVGGVLTPINITGYEFEGEMRLSTDPSEPVAGGIPAFGTIKFTAQPSNNDTVTIGGTAITFVTGTPGNNQVQIGAAVGNTVAALLALLQASSDANLSKATYTVDITGLIITVTFKVTGSTGNAFTLAINSAGNTVSGATLSGGINPAELVFTIQNQSTSPGQVLMSLPQAQVDTLPTSVSGGLSSQRLKTPYVFDVKMKDTSGIKTRILEGLIYVSPQATQEVLP